MISLCYDMSQIKKFMLLDEIFKYASEPGANSENAVFTYDSKNIWISYAEENEILGIIKLEIRTNTMCQFHPYILERFNRCYIKMCHEFFEWFFSEMKPEFLKINAVIATCYPAAIRAAKLGGMTVEGVDRSSYTTSSGIHDRIMFGITKEEVKKWAEQ